jgi:hypothetical protein
MNIKTFFVNLGKLMLCGVIFAIGTVLGGMLVTIVGLQVPAMPEGLDQQSAMLFMLLESPLLALVLALLARLLAGGFWARTLMLFLLTWICNSVNNQIEAAAFAGMEEGFWFTVLAFLVPALSVSMAVSWLFPPINKFTLMDSVRPFFRHLSLGSWMWRFVLAAVIFVPVYYLFGMIVVQFTRSYYEQNLFGLEIPDPAQVLLTQLFRGILFFVACLPILIAWHGSGLNLFWRLGLALFYLVGFQSLLIASWMPWSLRLPHMIEILFDEFVYVGALLWLMRKWTIKNLILIPKPVGH